MVQILHIYIYIHFRNHSFHEFYLRYEIKIYHIMYFFHFKVHISNIHHVK